MVISLVTHPASRAACPAQQPLLPGRGRCPDTSPLQLRVVWLRSKWPVRGLRARCAMRRATSANPERSSQASERRFLSSERSFLSSPRLLLLLVVVVLFFYAHRLALESAWVAPAGQLPRHEAELTPSPESTAPPVPACASGMTATLCSGVGRVHGSDSACPVYSRACMGVCASLVCSIRKRRLEPFSDEMADFLLHNDLADGVIVEVGTAFGGLASKLLERLPQLTLHAMDPFLDAITSSDGAPSRLYQALTKELEEDGQHVAGILQDAGKEQPASEGALSPASLSTLMAAAMEYDVAVLQGACCRYILHHNSSVAVASRWKSDGRQLVDVVFLSGKHAYDDCRSDIEAWAPLIRPGGWLVFNGFTTTQRSGVEKTPLEVHFEGVNRAVDEFAVARGHAVIVVGSDVYRNAAIQLT